jgi:hypothetical protein
MSQYFSYFMVVSFYCRRNQLISRTHTIYCKWQTNYRIRLYRMTIAKLIRRNCWTLLKLIWYAFLFSYICRFADNIYFETTPVITEICIIDDITLSSVWRTVYDNWKHTIFSDKFHVVIGQNNRVYVGGQFIKHTALNVCM